MEPIYALAHIQLPSYKHHSNDNTICCQIRSSPGIISVVKHKKSFNNSNLGKQIIIIPWYRICAPLMICDCKAKHCRTSTRHHQQTAKDQCTGQHPAYALLLTDPLAFLRLQSNPNREIQKNYI